MSSPPEISYKLRARYAEGLPAKWRVIEEALVQLRADDPEAEDTLRRIAHQVRGSAASFGFVAVDKTASKVEYAEDLESLEQAAVEFVHALRSAYESQATPITRVLLIDDDPEIGFIMTALLDEHNLDITQVTSAAAAIAELEANTWNMIFVDLVLPDADGRTLLTQIRNLAPYRDTPVVVLSAKTSSLVKNECSVYGIDDFIEKPIDPATFAGRVAALLERTRLQQPITQIDQLTGLPNRLGFRRALAGRKPGKAETLALAIIDVEHFEDYEVTNGRKAADHALRTVAELLQASIRSGDLLGRWGGAEFLLAFPNLSAVDAIELLGRASAAVRAHGLETASGATLTLCAGVTSLEPDELLDYGLLRADQLLRRARRGDAKRWYAHSLESTDDGRPKILLAEDDLGVASLLMHDLADDFDITHVANGDAAIEVADKQTFDLVLLDYQMPGRDGVEVVRGLRERPEYQRTPILLLTAIGSDAAIEAAFDAGADDYINKPHRRRPLLARLSRHLGRSPATPREDEPASAPRHDVVETFVTALFCDISGFTGISANLAPREVLDLLNSYFPAISNIVLRHGGRLEKYIGDAVLAVWGAPEAHEDDAVHALEAAVEIQAAVLELAESLEPPLQVHIGLNSGPVVAASLGDENFAQFAAIGDTTNIASRICELAGPGEIVLGDATVEALAGRERWPLSEVELVEVRGREEPISIRRLSYS